MKKLIILLLSAIAITAVAGSNVGAMQTYEFLDTVKNWPGQNVPDTWENRDNFLNPVIDRMTVNITNEGYLDSVILYMEWRDLSRSTFFPPFCVPAPDSLFINTGVISGKSSAWDSWDYYVRDMSDDNPKDKKKGHYYGESTLYTVNEHYVYSGAWYGRVGHANGIDDNSLSNDKGIDVTYTNNINSLCSINWDTLTYDFSRLNTKISMGYDWSIGYTPECANDVMLVNGPPKPDDPNNPVPEPATMVLLGMGLIGVAGVVRKRKTA